MSTSTPLQAALVPFMLVSLLNASPAPAREASPYRAADSAAPPVTAGNLIESERFWPYQVELTGRWQPPGRDVALPPRSRAILVRVEPEGPLLAVGRSGVYSVPLEQTDLLERANEIRTGKLAKSFPNFVLAIGPRLVDSRSAVIQPVELDEALAARGFLSVHSAPEDFPGLAAALRDLGAKHGVWTVLFPQGRVPDPEIRAKLRELDWKVPFVRDELSEAYTRVRVRDGAELPYIQLQTPEGRLLFEAGWSGDAKELREALVRDFEMGRRESDAGVPPPG